MNKLLQKVSISALMFLYPVLSFAQATYMYGTCAGRGGAFWLLCRIQELLNAVLPVLIALGVVYFVWGVVMYMIADSEEAKTQGRDKIIYGVIGLFVIISLWGLVYLVSDTFGLYDGAPTRTDLDRLLPGRN